MSITTAMSAQNGYSVLPAELRDEVEPDEHDGEDPCERRALHQQEADDDQQDPGDERDPTPGGDVERHHRSPSVTQ